MAPYEELEHTADAGLRLRGADLASLFHAAAEGFAALVLPGTAGRAAQRRPDELVVRGLRVEAQAPDLLLRAWLAALLKLCALEGLLVAAVPRLRVTDTAVEADLLLLPLSPADRRDATEIKAVTYHGLVVTHDAAGWVAEVVFDT